MLVDGLDFDTLESSLNQIVQIEIGFVDGELLVLDFREIQQIAYQGHQHSGMVQQILSGRFQLRYLKLRRALHILNFRFSHCLARSSGRLVVSFHRYLLPLIVLLVLLVFYVVDHLLFFSLFVCLDFFVNLWPFNVM